MNIIYLDAFAMGMKDLDTQKLDLLGEITYFDRTKPEEIVERSKNANILMVNKVKLGEKEFSQLPNLKHIAVTATGYDIIDINAAKKYNITVSNGKDYSSKAVAQHTFALLLAINNMVLEHKSPLDWAKAADFTYYKNSIQELHGKTLGLIGVGSIGEEVAKIGEAFGLNILINRASDKKHPVYQTVGLEELLQKSDIISLHLPLTDKTFEFMNAKAFIKMKNSSILINTARGALINELDLANALNEGQLYAAGLDVLQAEPPQADNPLFKAKNLLISPHIAWAAVEARQRLMNIVIGNIESFIAGKARNLVG